MSHIRQMSPKLLRLKVISTQQSVSPILKKAYFNRWSVVAFENDTQHENDVR